MSLRWVAAVLLAAPCGLAATRPERPKEPALVTVPEQMPATLALRTPEDLVFRAAAERQYLVFALLASGKAAWDRGDFAQAAERWESLLRVPGLSPELDALVRPLVPVARAHAGSTAPVAAVLPVSLAASATEAPVAVETTVRLGTGDPPVTITPVGPVEAPDPRRVLVTVSGLVGGGGPRGTGGAVVLLRRADGPTPRPRAARVRSIVQREKRYLPHVLAVPLGATVEFRNEDDIFHNVFSLSKPNDFDLGLYKGGKAREQVFASPGPVQLLCNIHSSMQAWVYVSDTPWFGQADAQGRFSIRGVPPGPYTLEVWHEWATKPMTRPVTVALGMAEVVAQIDGDRRAPAFVPDKSGKPRQPQLGY